MAYAALGDAGKATVDLTEAIKNAPEDPRSFLARGVIYAKLDYKKWARDDLKRVLEMTDDSEIREAAEEVLAELGGDQQGEGLTGFFKKLLG
jgi:regulator of sirC expression with transglutaminase-like and TPR domain